MAFTIIVQNAEQARVELHADKKLTAGEIRMVLGSVLGERVEKKQERVEAALTGKAFAKPAPKPVEVKQERSRVLPLTGSKSSFSLADKVGEDVDFEKALGDYLPKPERKVPQDVFVHIECPTCHHTGTTGTREFNRYTPCPECNERLFNRPAAGTRFGELDDDGNYYHATTLYFERTPEVAK